MRHAVPSFLSSLGGLVWKEVILLSRNNPEAYLLGIFDRIKGIIFMGTPHKGAWMADWAKIPASALGVVKSTTKSLLKILGTDDQFLESNQVRFWAMIRELREGGRRLEVTCFFEELPLPALGKVVSKEYQPLLKTIIRSAFTPTIETWSNFAPRKITDSKGC